jgi:hypothetical protein
MGGCLLPARHSRVLSFFGRPPLRPRARADARPGAGALPDDAIYAVIDCLGQVEGVPDKKALAALKEAKRKLDELYREVMSRKRAAGEGQPTA